MELQLVNFEQAKALKELGFPQGWGCETHYCLESEREYGYKIGDILSVNAAHKNALDVISAPTLELAAKFFRDEKNISLEPYKTETDWVCFIIDIPSGKPKHQAGYNGDIKNYESSGQFNTFEEALSAGIDKAIEHLRKEGKEQ